VTAAHDRKFFDTFMLIVGALVALTLGLIILARMVSSDPSAATREADADYQKEVVARIQPFAREAVAGQDNSALAPPAPVQTVAADMGGEEVYDQACVACHGAGIAGAPKIADKGAWASRIAQGMDTLHKHAIEGYTGKSGVMPPKGGRTDLSDQSIINAVDYMVAQSK
jgi:cytochrome c5